MIPASSNRDCARGPLPSRQRGPALGMLLVLLGAYFSVQVLVRVLVSDSLELDEAEQMLATRTLQAGYGTQPPLYAWLQYAFFQVFGVSIFAMALLKNLLLFGTYFFTAQAARTLLAAPVAALAALAMMWLPQIAWDSQRDLTHSVLVTTISAATLHLLARLVQRPRPGAYAALGAALGLGVLAKYNYVALAALLALTVLLVPGLRRRVLSPWLLLTLAVAAVIVAPHALWLLEHWQLASAGTMHKMAVQSGQESIAGVLGGLGSAAFAVFAFVSPLWIVLLGFFGSRLVRARHAEVPDCVQATRRVVLVYLGLLAAMLAAMVLFGGVTHFRDRWLQPYLFAAPAMFFACFPELGEGSRARAMWRTTLGLALVVLALLAAKAPYEGARGKPGDLNEPMRALAARLRADGFETGGIVTGEHRLAGRLRLQFPEAQVVLAEEPGARSPARPTLIIASGDGLRALLARLGRSADADAIRYVELPYLYGEERALRARFEYVIVP